MMPRCEPPRRAGVTLVELLLVLALLGVLSAVTTLAVRRTEPRPAEDPLRVLADSLRHTLSSGRASHVRLLIGGAPVHFHVRPDGSVVADSAVAVDRLSGTVAHAP